MASFACPRCKSGLPLSEGQDGAPWNCPACGQPLHIRAASVDSLFPTDSLTNSFLFGPASTSPGAAPVPSPRKGRRRLGLKVAAVALLSVVLGIAGLYWLGPKPAEQSEETAAEIGELNWSFEHDEAGRTTRIADPAGRTTTIRYETDKQGKVRRELKDLPDGTHVTREFDRRDHLALLKDAHGVVRYEYDGFGRLSGVRRDNAPAITYGYDTRDRLTSVSVGTEWTVAYGYDFQGRVARIDTPVGRVSYAYETSSSGGRVVVRRLPNGVRTTWQYQLNGLLGSIDHASPDGQVVARFAHTYRPDGLIARVKERTAQGERTLSYEYDTVQRLASVTDSKKGTIRYRYDPFGNRIEVTRTDGEPVASSHDWAGRLMQHNGHACRHDEAGNLTEYAGTSGQVVVSHTATGQVSTVRTDRGSVRYEYDGDGNLVVRASGKGTTSFLPDPLAEAWRPLLAAGADGEKTFYLWDGESTLAAVTGGEVRFFLPDHQDSVACVVDRGGNVTERPAYGPFGELQRASRGEGLRPGFAGLFYDPQAGLYLTRARAYDPALGRFLQRDPEHRVPVDDQEDLSAYSYCANNPVNWVDPVGAAKQKSGSSGNLPWQRFEKETVGEGQTVVRGGGVEYKSDGRPSAGTFFDAKHVGNPLTSPYLSSSNCNPKERAKVEQRTNDLFDRAAKIVRDPKSGYHWYEVITNHPDAKADFERKLKERGILGTHSSVHLVDRNRRGPDNPPPARNIGGQGPPSGGGGSGPRRGSGSGGGGSNPQTPQKVGGVSLRGAGDALKTLGALKGVALDANGRVVLLSDDKGDIGLPPLRLDDVVTIFRSVYLHGQAPFVSIDPDPKDTRGPIHTVRHDSETADTYVGWVLFEADRVMKSYNVGLDTVTRRPIRSRVHGYKDKIELSFEFWDGQEEKDSQYRNWIVPSRAVRSRGDGGRLTLLDLELQVRTERTTVRDGKLVDAPELGRGKDSLAFVEWFTKNYEEIAAEVSLLPPSESGITKPVAVFKELQRFALVTAVAENLRDSGIPLPTWMIDYPVRPCPVPKTTPAASRTETREVGGTSHKLSIWGGAELSPPPARLTTVASAPAAEALAPAVSRAVAGVPSFQPVRFTGDGKEYQAVALPGDTQAVGGVQLEEADVVVPVRAGTDLRLTRSFRSFQRPLGVFGRGWALDLPSLVIMKRPYQDRDGKNWVREVYQLTSPLGTWSEIFTERKFIPEWKGEFLVPRSSSEMLGIYHDAKEKTTVLAFNDDRRWHFDAAGRLVAMKEGPFTVAYHRDGIGCITQIEGRHGKESLARLDVEYDSLDRIASVRGSNGASARYGYDAAGRLERVDRQDGKWEYRYRDTLVSGVLHNDKLVREMEYGPGGQLVRDTRDGKAVSYQLASGPSGVRVKTSGTDGSEEMTYDNALRPVRQVGADGSRTEWRYDAKGNTDITLTLADGETMKGRRSGDGRQETWQMPEGGSYEIRYDARGRPAEVLRGGQRAVRREWDANGRLVAVFSETEVLRPQYDANGMLTSVVTAPPGSTDDAKVWQQVFFDEEGRPVKVTDHTGAFEEIVYDRAGKAVALAPSKNSQVRIKHNRAGRVESVQTPWGQREANTYDPASGELRKTVLTQGTFRTEVEYERGRPARVRQLDGGEFRFAYHSKGAREGLLREVSSPNGLVLAYEYDEGKRLTSVTCGQAFRLRYSYDGKGRLTGISQLPIRQ
ncbi:MAG: hypothetical protein HYS12_20425 [Planctomycetes bacterium]|nr:hypothetical protein [Planctomycetota bacterium]